MLFSALLPIVIRPPPSSYSAFSAASSVRIRILGTGTTDSIERPSPLTCAGNRKDRGPGRLPSSGGSLICCIILAASHRFGSPGDALSFGTEHHPSRPPRILVFYSGRSLCQSARRSADSLGDTLR